MRETTELITGHRKSSDLIGLESNRKSKVWNRNLFFAGLRHFQRINVVSAFQDDFDICVDRDMKDLSGSDVVVGTNLAVDTWIAAGPFEVTAGHLDCYGADIGCWCGCRVAANRAQQQQQATRLTEVAANKVASENT